MKPQGYIVRIASDRVTVEHRASFRPRTVVLLGAAYTCYCLLPGIRKVLVSFYKSHDPVIGCFALLMLLIPFLSGASWLFFASGEVMRCDAKELQIARRRSWGRWHRLTFPSAQIRELRRASRGSGRNRSFSVLSFSYEGRTFDLLEDLSWTDSDRVLKACKSLGLDAIVSVDDAAPMLSDIAKRGWLVNPWRPDSD